MWLPGEGGCLYSGEAGSSGAIFAGGSVLPVLNCLALITTVKDGRVCAVKVIPRRLTLSYIPNSWVVFIQYTTASLAKGGIHLDLSKCQTKKKVEPRRRSPAFVNHVSPWPCRCTCIAKGVDFGTTDYW